MEKVKVIEQIAKLMELAEKSNQEGEVESAKAAIKRLLVKYDMSAEDVKKGTVEFIETVYGTGRKTSYKFPNLLAQEVAKFCGVFFLVRRTFTETKYILCGREQDIVNAEYLIASMQNQMKAALKIYQKEVKAKGMKWSAFYANGFQRGFIDRVRSRLREMTEAVRSNRNAAGLVPTTNAETALQKARDSYSGEWKYAKERRSIMSRDSYGKGVSAGSNASIGRGVNGSGGNKTLALN